MSALIKREDAIKALEREKSDWNCDYNVPIDNCIKRLNKVKSADRPQGEWIDSQGRPMRLYESYSANCSACGEWSEYLTEYCPHCGARMKGADDVG